MHVRFTNKSENDLHQIHDYIADYNSAAATRVIDSILQSISQLQLFPLLGRYGRVDGTHELSVPNTPYFIIYSIADEYHIDIDAIFHERQKYPPV